MGKKVNEEIIRKICDLYSEDKKVSEIELIVGLSDTSIRNILKEKGIFNPKKGVNKEDLINDYLGGYSIEKLEGKYNISHERIYYILKGCGVKANRNLGMKDIPEIDIENIVRDYEINNLSMKSISKKYNYSYSNVINVLKDKSNIIEKTDLLYNPRLNNRYFNVIDTPEKAYWLGWILTDGGVSDGDLFFSLVKKDSYILKLLEKDLGLENKTKINGNYCRFSIGSKIMCNDLKQYGVIPNKSLGLKFPNNINESLMSHFLRGCFDGDGGLSVLERERQLCQELSFTGTYDMCDKFRENLLKNLDINDTKISKNGNNVYRVRWGAIKDCIKILEYLYTDCDDHKLERKYNKYLELKDRLNKNKIKPNTKHLIKK